MKKLRYGWSWPSTLALLVFGAALALVVASCGEANGPVSPSATQQSVTTAGSGERVSPLGDVPVEPTPTPTVTPTPTPEPSPSPTPPPGVPCSPGYWKNHPDEFQSWCGSVVGGWTCDSLWTALTCKGSDSSCQRSAAAAALNAVSGCFE